MNSSIAKKAQIFNITAFNFTVNSILIVDQDVRYDNEFEIDKLTAKLTVQIRAKLTALIKLLSVFEQFLHVTIPKQKKVVSDEKKRDEHRDKIARVMLILIT